MTPPEQLKEGSVETDLGAAPDADQSETKPTATRFAPIIAAAKEPPFTAYHAKYLAYELTKQVGADQADKLAQSLCNAMVDLNPYQVDAALFAFRSPLSRGAILADEVGLGKTIEAGIIGSQLWAEKKRRILVIAPASLRKQWSRELADKFFIPSLILESKSFRELSRKASSPFQQSNQVVICSYQFARARAADIMAIPWDLVIIDEAHRLRNVYKKDNKIARALREALRGRPKVLLTATPLQNSLMELFGLVTFVDEHVFGSEEAFRELYAKKSDQLSAGVLANLRARLAPICQRTLRKQVTEYVRYTKRIPITEDFTPSSEEQRLYDQVSAYLQRDNLHALPNSQRQLIELVLRKILASSSFAIAATLGTMIDRLRKLERTAKEEAGEQLGDIVGDDFEQADSVEDEWKEAAPEDGDAAPATPPADEASAELLRSLRAEAQELTTYKTLAESIRQNAKGESLIKALRLGFAKAVELKAKPKALIFTESRRTQAYRPAHPLAERLITRAKQRALLPCELVLDYARRGARVSLVERLRGQSGWLCAEQLTITSLDIEQTLLLTGSTDDGHLLDRETCEKLLTVPATLGDQVELDGSVKAQIEESLRSQENRILGESQKRNEVFFDAESDKLDCWADDLKDNLERELKNIELEIREAKKAKRLALDLESKIAAQKRINELEQQRNQKKRTLFDAQDDIEQKKDTLIAEVESRLQQRTSRQEIFAVRWRMR